MTDALPISRFPVPDLANMPGDVRNRILAVQEKSGFIPNVFLVLAHRPDEFRAFFAYHAALMERPGNLTKAEREMIVVATSSSNQCQYCVVAHGAILRIRAKNPLISVQVAINYRKADITERQKAMLDFALKVSRSAETVGEADFDVLKSVPFLNIPLNSRAGFLYRCIVAVRNYGACHPTEHALDHVEELRASG